MEYTAQIFYDVAQMNIEKLARYYKKFGIQSPKSDEKLRTPFHITTAVTTFEPITRSQVIELTHFVLNYSKCRIEIGSLSDGSIVTNTHHNLLKKIK